MDRIRRWLVPETRRRKTWQAAAYLIVIVLALSAAGIKYATTSYPSAPPAIFATSPVTGGVKGQGTKQPTVVPVSRDYTAARTAPAVIPSAHRERRPAPVPVSPPFSGTAPATAFSAPVTVSPEPSPPSPAPSSPEPSVSSPEPSATASAPSSPAQEVTTDAPPPGGLRLTG